MNDILLDITKTNSDCAQYTGTVTIASYLGDRLLQKETHHNAGLQTLFEFISSCLQGNWYEARDKRPCKLVLLKAPNEEQDRLTTDLKANAPIGGWSTPNNPNAVDNDGNHYWSAKYSVCSPVMYDTAAIAENTSESSSTTYHFRVPFLSLIGGSKIKKLMLVPSVTSDYAADACAYFVLNEEIPVPEAGANFTVIIDWTLTFTNNTAT